MKKLLAIIFLPLVAWATTRNSDGTSTDTQTQINASSDGDVVQLPSGSFTWTAGVTISGKGITVQGNGGGRVDGASNSSLAIGTGSKSFTIYKQNNGSGTSLSSVLTTFTVGETVRATYKANNTKYMEGTVTSYDGTTLVLNIITTGGSGTIAAWTLSTAPITTLVNNLGSTSTMFAITEDATHSVVLGDFAISSGTAAGSAAAFVTVAPVTNGKPFIWHDARINNTNNNRIIHSDNSRGLIYKCYWNTGLNYGTGSIIPGYGLVVKNDSNTTTWNETSRIGTQDTDGLGNFYVEQCYFQGLEGECFDSDAASRLVVRNSVFDNSAMTSHGADTSLIGNRHVQIYDNLVIFNDLGAETAALDSFFYIRGGTAVITDNYIPDITSSYWGNKAEIKTTVQNLQRNAGPNPVWGSAVGGVTPGQYYPAPRQVGRGYITGAGTAGPYTQTTPNSYTVNGSTDSVTYVGDSEPIYQWNNAGGGNYASPTSENYSTPTTDQDSSANYIQVGRDYINGTLSGFTKYQYPSPWRVGGGAVGSGAGVGGTLTLSGNARIN